MALDFADVIGPATHISGTIEGAAPLLVAGRVEGTVLLSDHLYVAAGGHVAADVTADIVTVEGTVEGRIAARERIVVRPGANVKADLRTPALVFEEGARMAGTVEMDLDLPEGVKLPGSRS